ncbi:hypothetical protein D3C78_1518820 [compost metagenome]
MNQMILDYLYSRRIKQACIIFESDRNFLIRYNNQVKIIVRLLDNLHIHNLKACLTPAFHLFNLLINRVILEHHNMIDQSLLLAA